MKKAFLFFSVLFFATANPLQAQSSHHVVLVTIDGFRPDFYKEDKWATPNLHQLVEAGSYADGVRGVFPTVTYPSHTTIMTGALPIRHGIYYNTPFEPDGETGRWYWEYNLIQVPTLWTAIHAAGMKTAGISWPVTSGAPIDYHVPEIWSLDKKISRLSTMRGNSQPKGFFEELETNATGKLDDLVMDADYMSRDESFGRMAAYIIRQYKPAFLAVHLPCVDHAEHMEGRDGPTVRRAVAGADHAIGDMLEAIRQAGLSDSTTVIVTGDHGFVDIHSAVAPNVWLGKAGLLDTTDSKIWKAKFHTSGAAAFLNLKDPKDMKTLNAVKVLLEKLPAGEKKLFRLVDLAELDKIGADPHVFLGLAPVPGITFNSSATGTAVKTAHGGMHGYFPDFKEIQTGFIAAGAGIAKGAVVPLMGLEDIAPLVATLLGVPFHAPDGVLYPGLLRGEKVNLPRYK